jgi:hypothetical protein
LVTQASVNTDSEKTAPVPPLSSLSRVKMPSGNSIGLTSMVTSRVRLPGPEPAVPTECTL